MIRHFALATIASATLVACGDVTEPLAPPATPVLSREAPATEYTLVDLGTLGGIQSLASAINKDGVVVGSSLTAAGAQHAFVFVPREVGGEGRMQDLGTLPGWNCSIALGLNDRGDVVGYACNEDFTRSQPVLWRRLSDATGWMIEELPGLGGHKGSAAGINERGEIAGNSCTEESITHLILWTRAGMRDLGTANGTSAAGWDINSRGQMAVVRDYGENKFTISYLWSEEGGLEDIGNLGGTGPTDGTIAQALNDRGEMTGGGVTADGLYHAFYWSRETAIQDLGTLGGFFSEGHDIGERGEIVGLSETANGLVRGFIWRNGRGMSDLGSLVDGGFSWATGVNKHGQIAGGSDTAGGQFHAVVWTPRVLE